MLVFYLHMSDCLKTWELVRYLSKPWFLLPLVQMAPLAHLPLPTPVQAWQISVRWTSTWAKIFLTGFLYLCWVSPFHFDFSPEYLSFACHSPLCPILVQKNLSSKCKSKFFFFQPQSSKFSLDCRPLCSRRQEAWEMHVKTKPTLKHWKISLQVFQYLSSLIIIAACLKSLEKK